jgi:hypothetical protein
MAADMRPLALCALLALGPASLARGDSPRLGLRFEAGAEYDSNAGRVEEVEGSLNQPRVVASPVGRFVAAADLAVPFEASQLSLFASVAGKAFTRSEARSENVMVAEAAGGYGRALGSRVQIHLGGTYYDVFQASGTERRDFRSGAPLLRLDVALGQGGRLSAGGGYRLFTYKPDATFDFSGPTALLDYRHLWPGADPDAAEWELGAGVSGEARGFSGARCISQDCPLTPPPAARRDRFVVAHLDAARTGDFLAGAGLAAHLNLSNSYGETLARGLVHVRAVVLLPLELSLSGRAELVLTGYREAVPLARNTMTGNPLVSIEDESRSTVRLELIRPLGKHVDLGARYTLYSNEIASSPVRYRRQTGLIFVALIL